MQHRYTKEISLPWLPREVYIKLAPLSDAASWIKCEYENSDHFLVFWVASGGGGVRMLFLVPKQCFWVWKLSFKASVVLESLGGGGEGGAQVVDGLLWLCDVGILDGPIFDQFDFKKYRGLVWLKGMSSLLVTLGCMGLKGLSTQRLQDSSEESHFCTTLVAWDRLRTWTSRELTTLH